MSEPSGLQYRALPGSERTAPTDATPMGPLDPNERIQASVYLRPRTPLPAPDAKEAAPLTREEYAQRYGADPAEVAQVENFARAHNLDVVDASVARRVVTLAGTVADMTAAFQVDLQNYKRDSQQFHARSGHVHVPQELASIITSVLGLDNRPQATTRVESMAFRPSAPILLAMSAASVSYTPLQLASLYNFPTSGNGQGETIAIIELGGGYQQADLNTYFQQLGLTAPTVTAVSVDGGANQPVGDPNSADGEVMLDIEVAGALAPGASIAVYFAPNSDQGFIDAVTTAVHDTTNKPSVISISWGGPESSWTAQAQQQMTQAFQDAGNLGVTVCVAAGDNGAADGVSDGLYHVDFPASSPYALGCGGTRLSGSGSTITSETVWNDGTGSATGGGVSDTYDLPTWQANAGVPTSANGNGRVGRGVPDVSGDADPQTGYQVLVDGQSFVIGGTSAVAPLWAGLIALINQQLGKPVGFFTPTLYGQASVAETFRDITSGNNNGYSAGPGWDPCTGLGSPNGAALLSALQAVAGQPTSAGVSFVPPTVDLSAVTPPTATAPASEPAIEAESGVAPVHETPTLVTSNATSKPDAPEPRGIFAALRTMFRRNT